MRFKLNSIGLKRIDQEGWSKRNKWRKSNSKRTFKKEKFLEERHIYQGPSHNKSNKRCVIFAIKKVTSRGISLKEKTKKNPQDEGNTTIIDGYESVEVLTVATQGVWKKWIIDSSSSFHMTSNKELFETYNDREGGSILLGNNKLCEVIGIGTIWLKLHDGVERILEDFRYVPELKKNIDFFRCVW